MNQRGHRSPQFWDQLDRAKKHGFTFRELKRGQIVVVPPVKTLPAYTTHPAEEAIHPLRRYLNKTLAAMGVKES